MEFRGMFWIFTVFLLAISFPGADALSADVAGIIAAAVIVAVVIIVIVIIVVCYFMRTWHLREKQCVHCKSKEIVEPRGHINPAYSGPPRPFVVPVQTVQTFYAPVMPPRPPMMYVEDRRSSKDSSIVEEPKEEPLPDTHQTTDVVEPTEKVRQYEVKTTSLEMTEDDITGNVSDEIFIRDTLAKVGPPPKTESGKDYVIVDYVEKGNRQSTVIHNVTTDDIAVSFRGSEADPSEIRDELVGVTRTSSARREPISLTQSQIRHIEAREYIDRQREPATIIQDVIL